MPCVLRWLVEHKQQEEFPASEQHSVHLEYQPMIHAYRTLSIKRHPPLLLCGLCLRHRTNLGNSKQESGDRGGEAARTTLADKPGSDGEICAPARLSRCANTNIGARTPLPQY